MRRRQRKGIAHVLEAIIAAFILFLFVLSVTNFGGSDAGARTKTVHKQTLNTLHSLDMNGTLRPAVTDRNLSALKSMVSQYAPNRNTEIALSSLNATTQDISFTDQHSLSFDVPETAERQQLRIWYRNANAPNISINGQYIQNYTETRTNSYETFDISPQTALGSNTLRIDTDGSADIGYSIDIYNMQRTGEPPSNTDVFTTTYVVSGSNTTFAPAEVTVITWY